MKRLACLAMRQWFLNHSHQSHPDQTHLQSFSSSTAELARWSIHALPHGGREMARAGLFSILGLVHAKLQYTDHGLVRTGLQRTDYWLVPGCRTVTTGLCVQGCGTVNMGTHAEASAALAALDNRHRWVGMDSPMVVKWVDRELQKRRKEGRQSGGEFT